MACMRRQCQPAALPPFIFDQSLHKWETIFRKDSLRFSFCWLGSQRRWHSPQPHLHIPSIAKGKKVRASMMGRLSSRLCNVWSAFAILLCFPGRVQWHQISSLHVVGQELSGYEKVHQQALLSISDSVPPPKTLEKICWIHVQKASSWIGDYLVLQNCPDIAHSFKAYRRKNKDDRSFIYDLLFQGKIQSYCKVKFCPETFGFHNPYDVEKMGKGTVVALFRHPMNRIISAYLYNNEMMIPTGMPWDERYPIYNARTEGRYLPIYQYVQLPGMTGCQTKLTLGHNCGAGEKEIKVGKAEMEKAKKRMREDFAFVGLTEYPIETEKLFRAMYGGVELIHLQPQKIKYRENKKHTSLSHAELYTNLTSYNWKDPIDEEFYEEAKKIFFERCKLYKVPITTVLPDPSHPEIHRYNNSR